MSSILVFKHMADYIDEFLAEIEPYSDAFDTQVFCFLAFAKPDGMHIAQARLHLDSVLAFQAKPIFRCGDILAGQLLLGDYGKTLKEFLTEFATGLTRFGQIDLVFDHPSGVNSSLVRFHEEGIRQQRRLPLLSVSGDDQVSYNQQPETDWQLRSASPPYDSLAELANDYRIGISTNNGADFAVIPAPIAIVEYNSPVKGSSATPTIRINHHLLPEEVSLGLRIILDDAVVRRESIDASKIQWEIVGDTLRGTTKISIPEGSSIQCILRYRGRAMHYGWLADPEGKANPLRTLLRAFDTDLGTLGDYLFVEPGKGKSGKSTDLEHGVAWLLWMLGFAVLDLGVSPKTSDAVDIVAVSPSGVIFLIECTIGLLKADQKLARLAARTFKVRRELLGTNRKVIPVIVTSLTRDEVRPELPDAAALEVLVLTREDIKYALETRSLFQPHPEKLAAQAERALNATVPQENKH